MQRRIDWRKENGNVIEIERGSELDKAAEEFFAAAYRYRAAIKKHAPSQLGGVLWLRRGVECVVYSEHEGYTRDIASMQHDRHLDKIVFAEADEPEE